VDSFFWNACHKAILTPRLAAPAAFLGQEAMRLLLQTILADPYSSSLFVADNEEGLYLLATNFAFDRDHFGDSPIFSILNSALMAGPLQQSYPAFSIYKIF